MYNTHSTSISIFICMCFLCIETVFCLSLGSRCDIHLHCLSHPFSLPPSLCFSLAECVYFEVMFLARVDCAVAELIELMREY